MLVRAAVATAGLAAKTTIGSLTSTVPALADAPQPPGLQQSPQTSGPWKLVNNSSKACLNWPGSDRVATWACNGTIRQTWVFEDTVGGVAIRSNATTRDFQCITGYNDASVKMRRCNGTDSQTWSLDYNEHWGGHSFVNRATGGCLDWPVKGGDLGTWHCNQDDHTSDPRTNYGKNQNWHKLVA